MTNKPMLSADLRKALADFIEYSVPGPRSDDAMWYADKQALRALLDKPAKDYVLINGMHFSHAEILEWREKACADMEKAAQHHGEPVAWLRLSAGGNPYCCNREDHDDTFPVYSEQPAPVAVVMPELKTPYYKVVPTKFGNKEGFWQITPDSSIVYDNRDEAQARADARNASRAQHFFDSLKPCLEEVARLNGVKP